MSIPDNSLSAVAHPGAMVNPWTRDSRLSLHWGPVALNDPDQGLLYQIWKARLDSDKLSVILSAPNTPDVVVFTRSAEISELSLAFDQNGRPQVAFVEDGAPWLWWFDPSPNDVVFTALAAGTINPRITLDDARPQNLANSDVILGYIRDGVLRYRQERDRYLVEYTPPLGPLGDPLAATELHHVSMNSKLRLQFVTDGGDEPPYLADIVFDLCLRSKIPAERIDVSELYDDRVPGMKVQSTDGFEEDFDRLRNIFFFDKSAHDKKIFWPKRGREPVAWIPYSDLLADTDQPLKQKLEDEQKLPREMHIEHIDPDGGYAKNKQTSRRRSNLVKAKKSETIKSGLVLTADQAATGAMQKLKQRWGEPVEFEFSTTLKYTFVTAADVVMVEDKEGVWHRIRIEERNEDTKVISWEGRLDAGARVYRNTFLTGNALDPPTSTTPGLVGETRFEILNIPVLRDQDDELVLGLAASGESSGWHGYQLLFSTDQGTTYSEAFQSETPCIIGDTLTQLLEDEGYEYPSAQTVEVLVNYPLTSISQDQIMQRKNLCVIGDEVLQFQTASLLEMVDGKYRYLLSGLVRGRFHTLAETWPQDTRFVLLDEAVVFAQLQRSYLGMDLWYKPVSLGATVDETVPTAYLFDKGVSQTEYPVSNVTAERDGSNNVTVTWVGAARLGFDTAPYHSKYFRGYRVRFSDTHTIDTYDQTAEYPSAPVGATVQVCALNEITGEGPYSDAIAT